MVLNETEGVQYELVDISELDEMAMIAAEAFTRYEPISSALNILSEDFAIEPPEGILHLSDKFKPVWTVLDELDSQYKRVRILPKGEYLHFFLPAVDHRQTGKNIAKNLVQTCIENGVRKGYKRGVVEATGVISQHIFRKFGFVDHFEVPYKTFIFQGNRIFYSIEDHHGIIFMDKALA